METTKIAVGAIPQTVSEMTANFKFTVLSIRYPRASESCLTAGFPVGPEFFFELVGLWDAWDTAGRHFGSYWEGTDRMG
jgi:hypothetical protein